MRCLSGNGPWEPLPSTLGNSVQPTVGAVEFLTDNVGHNNFEVRNETKQRGTHGKSLKIGQANKTWLKQEFPTHQDMQISHL
jgi:hypothetical protein